MTPLAPLRGESVTHVSGMKPLPVPTKSSEVAGGRGNRNLRLMDQGLLSSMIISCQVIPPWVESESFT